MGSFVRSTALCLWAFIVPGATGAASLVPDCDEDCPVQGNTLVQILQTGHKPDITLLTRRVVGDVEQLAISGSTPGPAAGCFDWLTSHNVSAACAAVGCAAKDCEFDNASAACARMKYGDSCQDGRHAKIVLEVYLPNNQTWEEEHQFCLPNECQNLQGFGRALTEAVKKDADFPLKVTIVETVADDTVQLLTRRVAGKMKHLAVTGSTPGPAAGCFDWLTSHNVSAACAAVGCAAKDCEFDNASAACARMKYGDSCQDGRHAKIVLEVYLPNNQTWEEEHQFCLPNECQNLQGIGRALTEEVKEEADFPLKVTIVETVADDTVQLLTRRVTGIET